MMLKYLSLCLRGKNDNICRTCSNGKFMQIYSAVQKYRILIIFVTHPHNSNYIMIFEIKGIDIT